MQKKTPKDHSQGSQAFTQSEQPALLQTSGIPAWGLKEQHCLAGGGWFALWINANEMALAVT